MQMPMTVRDISFNLSDILQLLMQVMIFQMVLEVHSTVSYLIDNGNIKQAQR